MAERHPCEGLPEQDLEMLNEPLTTEEGFLNPVCLAELEAKIKGVPEAHERLRGKPEWSVEYPMLLDEIVGALASWAIRQSGGIPPDLGGVCAYLRECLKREEGILNVSDIPMFTRLSLCDLNKKLWEILEGHAPFEVWNNPGAMQKAGCDFVDISALLRNVCISIRDRRRHDYAFDRKFEREHEERHGKKPFGGGDDD